MSRCRSILRGIQKKLVRLPQISPVPDNVPPANDFNKMLTSAKKIKKENGDAYLGVDTLLQAVIETSKEVQECLNEAGRVSGWRAGMHGLGSLCRSAASLQPWPYFTKVHLLEDNMPCFNLHSTESSLSARA